jgi:hypothetical protein
MRRLISKLLQIDHRRHGPDARRAKASVKRRRADARRNAALFLSPIAVALAVLWMFGQNVPVFASSWRAPLAVLTDRSPGGRASGALYNTKPLRLAPVTIPHERVLTSTRVRPEPELEAFLPPEAPLDLLSDAPILLETAELIPDPAIAQLLPPRIELLTEPVIAPVTIPSGVPEPATWLMYLVGFFALGSIMRRRPQTGGRGGLAVAAATARR